MASIRRTLSPAYHDGTHINGAVNSPLSLGSPSHKLFSNSSKYSSSSPSSILCFSDSSLRRFISAAFPPKKKGGFRRFFYRCLPFFVLGFLLGIFPFGPVNSDIPRPDFSLEIKPPHADVRLNEDDNRGGVADGALAVNSLKLVEDTQANYSSRFDFLPRKQIIVVTPTYNRALQAYLLNRLGQVLSLVRPPLLWIVVEMKAASMETAEILRKTGVMYRHLVCSKNSTSGKDRVYQRNVALEHVERHRLDGVVYFADDDNVYSLELFESLREINRFGTWPVAMLERSKNKAILEGPVCNGSQVIGWHTNEKSASKRLRRFHVDMSGFAFNSTILWDPKRWQRPFLHPIRQLDTAKEGFKRQHS
ncbi:hypothetical protein K2173_027443 [Erythroxylum novogranatense]|uniref:Glycosyltransferases n=1 Tax=Erythroxylum novogranatense TaxID=1862640 RepID=A0AAV8TZ44_9ROSI|nr:hypothetical protein K2173_027443 [Erythroxylum novogranatense]